MPNRKGMFASYHIARACAHVTRNVTRMVAFAVTTVALLMVPCSAGAVGVGQLDETFNGTGTVVTPVSGGFSDVIVDTSGNTIAVGRNGSNDVLVAKYLPNGSLDTSFGGGGVVTFSVGAGNDVATAVALSSTGGIVAAGTSSTASFVTVLEPDDGDFDSTFNSGAPLVLDFQPGVDTIEDIQISAGDKITFAGTTSNSVGGPKDVLIGRLNADGTFDTDFNFVGWRAVNNLGDDMGHALVVRPDGRIFVAGTTNAAGNADMLVAGFLPDGSSLTTWAGGTGRIMRDVTSPEHDAALAISWHQPSNSFAVAGATGDDSFVGRLTDDGTWMSGFGTGGIAIINVSAPIVDVDMAHSVFVEDVTDNVIVAGTTTVPGGGAFYAMRLLSNGSPDPTWNGTGRTVTAFGPDTYSFAAALGNGAYPTITVAGEALGQLGLVRYTTEPHAVALDLAACTAAENGIVALPSTITISGTDCVVGVSSNAPLGVTLMIAQADGVGTALTGPSAVPDYAGFWSGDEFGICLREAAGGMSPAGGMVAAGASCPPFATVSWRNVPPFQTTVASSSGTTPSGVVRFRFGLSASPSLLPGTYSADITFTVVANP